jgi:hypothetical protein
MSRLASESAWRSGIRGRDACVASLGWNAGEAGRFDGDMYRRVIVRCCGEVG